MTSGGGAQKKVGKGRISSKKVDRKEQKRSKNIFNVLKLKSVRKEYKKGSKNRKRKKDLRRFERSKRFERLKRFER